MNTPISRYKKPLPSMFSTPFRALYEAIWDAESDFELLFRQDKGVYVWAANRVRFYYELATKLGIYSPIDVQRGGSVEEHPLIELGTLQEVDAYVQTGALGPAAANRSRDFGCVFTERHVKALLDKGRSVLLLHDAPEKVADHPGLRVLTSRQLAAFSNETKEYAPARADFQISNSDALFWESVDAYFQKRLGVSFLDRERVDKLVLSHAKNLAMQKQLFQRVRPRCLILMAHYFRAPQIEAARDFGTRVIDYQHGINSRYHLGYGFPHLHSKERHIPYFPDEFWSWGDFWTDPDWFPFACCEMRAMGHYQAAHRGAGDARPAGAAKTKTLLCATSWAMQDRFLDVAANLAGHLPDWNIVIKLHPRERDEAYESVVRSNGNVTIVPGSVDILEASRTADIVVSICSSSLFDVLLNGCRVMVVDAPSVEYAEDFVRSFDVPVLNSDCSNVRECIKRCENQEIPTRALFDTPSVDYIDITLDSITSPLLGSRPKLSAPGSHGKRRSPGARKLSFKRRLYERVRRAVPERVKLRIRSAGLKSPEIVIKRLYARMRGAIPKIAKHALATERGSGVVSRQVQVVREIAAAEVLEDAQEAAVLIPEAVRLGTPTQPYRTKFLKLLWKLEQSSGQEEACQRMREYIAAVPACELDINLPVLEHAMRLGVEDALLQRLGVVFCERKWRTASALLTRSSHLARRMCDVVELMAECAAGEWLDSRVSRADQEGLYASISERIRSGEPFAMMRLGDGEVYGFSPRYVTAETLQKDQIAREEVWWGQEQPEALRKTLRDEFQLSLNSADYLGVPSPFRLLRDIPPFFDDLRRPIDNWHKTPRAHFILFTELAKLLKSGTLDLKGKYLVDDRCHQPLFTPSSTLALLSDSQHVVSISCFEKDRLNAALNADLIDDQILLPPHQKVIDIVPDSEIKLIATPELLEDIYRQIDALVRPGSVVLVAGGFVGKLLIARAKQRGGMVLDIGASSDYWVGRATRGAFDFVDYAESA